MVKQPDIDIIIPNYNKAKYLNQCLDSILSQTYKKFEIILIYDLEDEKYIESLISFASIKTNCIHKVNLKSVEVNEENVNKAKKCTKQIYQKEIMNYYFTDQFIDDVYSYEGFAYTDYYAQYTFELKEEANIYFELYDQ